MIEHRLFVYGTLKPGCENDSILKEIGGDFKKATLFGFTFDKKWESKTGYPGLIASHAKSKVEGYLFTSAKLKYSWSKIDNFETNMYNRTKVVIELNNNLQLAAYTYLINPNFKIANTQNII